MEHFLAIFCSLLISFIIIFYIWSKRKISLETIKYRQSDHHYFIKNFLLKEKHNKKKQTQLFKREENKKIKIVMTEDDKAYWVVNNTFFICNVINGQPDFDNGKPIETENMSKKELDKLMFILDNLDRGDENERGGSRD